MPQDGQKIAQSQSSSFGPCSQTVASPCSSAPKKAATILPASVPALLRLSNPSLCFETSLLRSISARRLGGKRFRLILHSARVAP